MSDSPHAFGKQSVPIVDPLPSLTLPKSQCPHSECLAVPCRGLLTTLCVVAEHKEEPTIMGRYLGAAAGNKPRQLGLYVVSWFTQTGVVRYYRLATGSETAITDMIGLRHGGRWEAHRVPLSIQGQGSLVF